VVVVIALRVAIPAVGVDAIAFQHGKTIFGDIHELIYTNNSAYYRVTAAWTPVTVSSSSLIGRFIRKQNHLPATTLSRQFGDFSSRIVE